MLRITTLSENTARMGFLAEWGLSILVETENHKILLDTGLNISAAYNAGILGIDLTKIDKIVLSHGHVDHTGGLREVLRRCGEVEVIAHPDIWASKYHRIPGEKEQYIGMPFLAEELKGLGASFVLSREPVSIAEDIMTTGEIPMTTDFEQLDSNLYVEEGGSLRPDELLDDQALIIRTEQGLVVILGCSHRGVINTLKHAQKLTGVEQINTVIGGTHLFRASTDQVQQTVAALSEFGIKRLGASHCTGFLASMRLSQAFGDIFFLNNAGTSITLPIT